MTDPTSVLGNLLWTPDGSPTEMESYASFVKAEKGFDWAVIIIGSGSGRCRKRVFSGHLCGIGMTSLVTKARAFSSMKIKCRELLFPDASINYAQNMLAEADDRPAIIAYGEDGRCTRLTRAELKTTVMALAGWMQSKESAEVTELLPTCQMVNMR